ncbi:MAG: hypothetical protein SF172_13065 [Burkholderiales bacterium]|nr:hypothetical protein [Burkholderiales bacterium]
MKLNPLFTKGLSNSLPLAMAVAAVSLAGCAALPDASTSAQPAAECRIAPVTTASIGGGKAKSVDKMDQIRAVNEFARFESSTRNLSPAMQVQFEELLRECGR